VAEAIADALGVGVALADGVGVALGVGVGVGKSGQVMLRSKFPEFVAKPVTNIRYSTPTCETHVT